MDVQEQQIKILEAIHRELLTVAQRDQSCLDVLKDQIRDLKTIVTGVDGTNGLRSISKQHEADLADLKKWRTQFMAVFAVVQLLGVPILIFLIQQFLK